MYTTKKRNRQAAIETNCEVMFEMNGRHKITKRLAAATAKVFFKIKNKKLFVKNSISLFFAK